MKGKASSALEILFEDSCLCIINKAPNIHSVISAKNKNASIAALLIKKDAKFKLASIKPEDGGLVQRLDYETSGVVIAAKNSKVWQKLYAFFQSGEIKKSYLAIVQGRAPNQKAITTFIGSPNRGAKKVRIFKVKPAKRMRALSGTTHFKRLAYNSEFDFSLMRIEASPARRHQVRVHAAHLNHPLVGDKLYGATQKLPAGFGKLSDFFLHAEMVSFRHPISNKEQDFVAPTPLFMSKLFPSFGNKVAFAS